MKYGRVHHAPAGKINVTPLIDVVMCLIVFYLIVGQLVQNKNAKVQLPISSLGAVEPDPAGLTINVLPGQNGTAVSLVNGTPVETAQLRELLLASAGKEVTIRADHSLSFEPISQVLAVCRETGRTSVRLAAARPGGR
jgi:biopolymer transport protein ExbD